MHLLGVRAIVANNSGRGNNRSMTTRSSFVRCVLRVRCCVTID